MILSQKTTESLFLLTIFSLPLYLWRFSFFSVPTNALELLALTAIFFFLLQKKRDALIAWKKNLQPILLPTILLFSGLFISFLFSGWNLNGLGIIKSWFVIPFLFSLSLPSILDTPEKITRAVRVFHFSFFSVALIALGYKLAGAVTYDYRLTAFYLSPNHLAMFLSPGLFLGAYLLLKEKNIFWKYFLYFSQFIIATALYFTFSYTAWVAVFFSFLFLSFLKKSFKKEFLLLVFIITLLFGLFFISQYDNPKLNNLLDSRSSLSSRMMIWESSLKMVRDNPLLGIGPGNFQTRYLEYQKYFPPYLEWAVPQPHNLYLAFYLQTGLLGLVGFLWFCWRWLTIGLKQKNTAFSAVSLGILFYILLHGLIDTPYWKNDLAYLFWIMFFLTIAIEKHREDSQKSNR